MYLERWIVWFYGIKAPPCSSQVGVATDQNCAYTFPVAWLVCTLLLAGCQT